MIGSSANVRSALLRRHTIPKPRLPRQFVAPRSSRIHNGIREPIREIQGEVNHGN
jgi:hypothetical protein